jgi:methanogenic corrinoid protein MtbC1
MTDGEIRDRINTLTDAQAQQERVINDLVQAMVDLDLVRIEKSLNGFISTKGMERTITQIIFPFLEKIGILWLTGHINPAQEHLVTNLIRQKLIVAIDSVHSNIQVDRSVLFFLPEGEHHELGILFMHYLLKSRGIQTIYLGANVPVKDLAYIIELKKPDVVFSHLTATTSAFHFEKFLNQVSQQITGTPVILSGLLTQHYKKTPPVGIEFKKSLQEVIEAIG